MWLWKGIRGLSLMVASSLVGVQRFLFGFLFLWLLFLFASHLFIFSLHNLMYILNNNV